MAFALKPCGKCEFSKIITAQDGYEFWGCNYGEYKGKRVREIQYCPRYTADEICKIITDEMRADGWELN